MTLSPAGVQHRREGEGTLESEFDGRRVLEATQAGQAGSRSNPVCLLCQRIHLRTP